MQVCELKERDQVSMGRLSTVQTRLEEVTLQRDDFQQAVGQLDAQADALEVHLEQANAQLAAAEAYAAQLQSQQLMVAEAGLVHVEASSVRVVELERELQVSTIQLEEAAVQHQLGMEEVTMQLEEAAAQHQLGMGELEQMLALTEGKLRQSDTESEKLVNVLNDRDTEVAQLRQTIGSLTAEVQSHNYRLIDMQEKLDDQVEASEQQLKQKLGQWQEKLSKADASVDGRAEELSQLLQEKEQAEAEARQLQQQLVHSEELLQMSADSGASIRCSLTEVTQHSDELATQLMQAQAANALLEASVEDSRRIDAVRKVYELVDVDRSGSVGEQDILKLGRAKQRHQLKEVGAAVRAAVAATVTPGNVSAPDVQEGGVSGNWSTSANRAAMRKMKADDKGGSLIPYTHIALGGSLAYALSSSSAASLMLSPVVAVF